MDAKKNMKFYLKKIELKIWIVMAMNRGKILGNILL